MVVITDIPIVMNLYVKLVLVLFCSFSCKASTASPNGESLCIRFIKRFGSEMHLNAPESNQPGSVIKAYDLSLIGGSSTDAQRLNLVWEDGTNGDFAVNYSGSLVEIVQNKVFDHDTNHDDNVKEMVMTCEEEDGQKVELALLIQVSDVNDNPPILVNLPASVEISELTSINETIFSIETDDADVNENAVVSLRLAVDSEYFGIASHGSPRSVFVKKKLDFENGENQNYLLTFVAENLEALPRLNATATLSITVYDGDDKSPMFEKHLYKASIAETPGIEGLELPSPIEVATVKAVDQDITINTPLIYSLINETAQSMSLPIITDL